MHKYSCISQYYTSKVLCVNLLSKVLSFVPFFSLSIHSFSFYSNVRCTLSILLNPSKKSYIFSTSHINHMRTLCAHLRTNIDNILLHTSHISIFFSMAIHNNNFPFLFVLFSFNSFFTLLLMPYII